MAELDSLIRVRKHTTEQKQKFLADLLRQVEELEQQKKNLETQMREEQENLKNMGVGMLNFFGPYTIAVKERLEDIEEQKKKLERRVQLAQEDVRLAFAELKKIEIIQERREAEERAEIKRKETQMLDDIGIDGFRRNEED